MNTATLAKWKERAMGGEDEGGYGYPMLLGHCEESSTKQSCGVSEMTTKQHGKPILDVGKKTTLSAGREIASSLLAPRNDKKNGISSETHARSLRGVFDEAIQRSSLDDDEAASPVHLACSKEADSQWCSRDCFVAYGSSQ